MKAIIKTIILFFVISGSLSAKTIIEGYAPEYAGQEIVLYTYTEQISMTESKWQSFRVAVNGDFKTELEINETVYAFMYFGKYKAFLYIEPKQTYRIALPAMNELPEKEKQNPYFKHEEVYVDVLTPEKNVLTDNIAAFDMVYGNYFNDNAFNFYRKRKPQDFTQFKQSIDDKFGQTENSYFQEYKEFKMAYLDYLISPHLAVQLFNSEIKTRQIHSNNPAYMNLLRELALPYFKSLDKKNKKENLYAYIAETNDLSKIKNKVSFVSGIENEELLELFLIQTLYSGHFKKLFSKKSLLTLLDNIKTKSKYAKNISTAKTLHDKLLKLHKGKAAPNFSLTNVKGDSLSLNNFEGKYIYLNFCRTDNYACKTDFSVLKNLYSKHQDKLEIVSIFTDELSKKDIKWLKKEKYNWIFLLANEKSDLLKKYDVNIYPTYFLIDPDGYILLSPAPSPKEDFEYFFFKEWEANRFKKNKDEVKKQ